MSFIASMAKDPTSLIMLVVGVVLVLIRFKILRIIGIGLVAASVIKTIISQPRESKELFEEAKHSIIEHLEGAFDVNKKKDYLSDAVSKTQRELKEDLKDVLSDDTSSYNKDARFMTSIKERFDEKMNQLSDKLEDELCKISHVQ